MLERGREHEQRVQGIARRRSSVLWKLTTVAAAVVAFSLTTAWFWCHAPGHGVYGPSRAYRLVWGDEFNGRAGAAPNPANWRLVTGGGWANNELECYTARRSNVSLDGIGDLVITARKERYTDGRGRKCNYTSARLQTLGRFETQYGRIEARIKLPATRGLWPAFWALGSNFPRVRWPASGEIDIVENRGPFTVFGVLHGPDRSKPRMGYADVVSTQVAKPLGTRFHVFGIDWGPGEVVFTFDGRPYSVQTTDTVGLGHGWVFDKPFYLLLNLAVGGNFTGRPTPETPFPSTMLVDWVRGYKQTVGAN